MVPLIGFRKYILYSQGCSEGDPDPAALGGGHSSKRANGPSLRDDKSGMQTMTEGAMKDKDV